MQYVRQYDPNTNTSGSYFMVGPILSLSGDVLSGTYVDTIRNIADRTYVATRAELFNLSTPNDNYVAKKLGQGFFVISASPNAPMVSRCLSATGEVKVSLSGRGEFDFGLDYIVPMVETLMVISRDEYDQMFSNKLREQYRQKNIQIIKGDPIHASPKYFTLIVGPILDVSGSPVTGLKSSWEDAMPESENNFRNTRVIHEQLGSFRINNKSDEGTYIDLTELDSTNLPGYYTFTLPCYMASAGAGATIDFCKYPGNAKLYVQDGWYNSFVPFEVPFYIETVSDRIRAIESVVTNGKPRCQVFYVSVNDGDDGNDGLGWDTPLQTIKAATDKLVSEIVDYPHSFIFVKSGIYVEDVVLPQNCTLQGIYGDSGEPIEILGYDGIIESTTDEPSLIIGEGSKAINITVGKKSAISSVISHIMEMKTGSHFLDGITSGIAVSASYLAIVSGDNCSLEKSYLYGVNKCERGISPRGDNCLIQGNTFSDIQKDHIYNLTTTVNNIMIKHNVFNNLAQNYYAARCGTYKLYAIENKIYFSITNTSKLTFRAQTGSVIGFDNISFADAVWGYTPRTLTSGFDSSTLANIWQATSGLGGEAMRGTDHVGSISADILSGGTLKVAGATIKDIEVRDSIVYLTYRDPADGKMKVFSLPFSQDIIIASGGDLT